MCLTGFLPSATTRLGALFHMTLNKTTTSAIFMTRLKSTVVCSDRSYRFFRPSSVGGVLKTIAAREGVHPKDCSLFRKPPPLQWNDVVPDECIALTPTVSKKDVDSILGRMEKLERGMASYERSVHKDLCNVAIQIHNCSQGHQPAEGNYEINTGKLEAELKKFLPNPTAALAKMRKYRNDDTHPKDWDSMRSMREEAKRQFDDFPHLKESMPTVYMVIMSGSVVFPDVAKEK